MGAYASVDEYLDSFVDPARAVLRELQALSRTAAPDSSEELRWGDPAYVHEAGVILFLFSGFKHHANFVFTPSTREAFDDELAEFATGKGSIKLPYGDAVPTELLTRMIEYRIREFEVNSVRWM